MLPNIIRIYVKADGTILTVVGEPLFSNTNYTTELYFITPLVANLTYATFLFNKTFLKRMRPVGLEDVEVNGVVQTWNVWKLPLGEDILALAFSRRNVPLKVSFRTLQIIQDPDHIFKGFFNSLLDLNTAEPAPQHGAYAAVGVDQLADVFTSVGGVWTASNMGLAEYEATLGIQNTKLIKTSAVVDYPVNPSIPGEYENFALEDREEFDFRLTELELQVQKAIDAQTDHTLLSLFSRNKPNQHGIDAISGLRPKVEVHVGEDEPTQQSDTWFDVEQVDEEVVVTGNWEFVASTPQIFLNASIPLFYVEQGELLKMVVIGNLAGETYRQEFQSDEYGYITGEAILSVNGNYTQIISVEFTLEPLIQNNEVVAFEVILFNNTGNINTNEFHALSIEVYR